MSGETERDVSGWTTDTLHALLLGINDTTHNDIASLRSVVETRLDAMDRAAELLNANMTRVPTDVDKQITHLRSLHDEKFRSVEARLLAVTSGMDGRFAERDLRLSAVTADFKALYDEKFHSIEVQFTERDTRAEQTSRDSKVAVDAALQAAKEAVGEQNKSSALAISKSEAATSKQIDQIATQISTSVEGIKESIADLKGRLDRGEGVAAQVVVGNADRRAGTNDHQWMVGVIISALFLAVSIISVAVVIASKVH